MTWPRSIVLVLVALAAFAACSSSAPDASKPATPSRPTTSSRPSTTSASVSDGARVFSTRCAGCHGPEGAGNLGPTLVGIATRRTPLELTAIVRGGRGMMPSFKKLTDGEVAAVVAYLGDLGDSGATP